MCVRLVEFNFAENAKEILSDSHPENFAIVIADKL